jgi:translation initiation factor IF-1
MPEPGSRDLEARVLEALPSQLYRVELLSQGRPRATVHVEAPAGPLRVREGDLVLVRLSPQDPGRGRIVGLSQ